jgi:hypothetical protein
MEFGRRLACVAAYSGPKIEFTVQVADRWRQLQQAGDDLGIAHLRQINGSIWMETLQQTHDRVWPTDSHNPARCSAGWCRFRGDCIFDLVNHPAGPQSRFVGTGFQPVQRGLEARHLVGTGFQPVQAGLEARPTSGLRLSDVACVYRGHRVHRRPFSALFFQAS